MGAPMGDVDQSRRTFLKSLVIIAGASMVIGMLRGLEVIVPPSVGISSFPLLQLVDENGNPIKASDVPINGQKLAMFNYPLNNEPNYLLNLGNDSNQPVEIPATTVSIPATGQSYTFPGGVGPNKSIVAYSALCEHLGCTYPELTFYPPGVKAPTFNGPMDKVIHCSCHGSTYDPYKGAAVITGPTTKPLPAVQLKWDPDTDYLYAVTMIGPTIYGHTDDLSGGSPISGNSTTVKLMSNPALG